MWLVQFGVRARVNRRGLATLYLGLGLLAGVLPVHAATVVWGGGDGFAMWTKRLEAGRFRPAFSGDGKLGVLTIEAAELALIVEGIDLSGARRRRRWQPVAGLEKSSRPTSIS